MRLLSLLALAMFAAGCAAAGTVQPRCRMAGVTQGWLEGSLASWDLVRTRQLRLATAPPPQLVVFDRYCAWTFVSGGFGDIRLRAGRDTLFGEGRAHGGTIALPNGLVIPVRGEAFASLLPGDSATVVVMALEDVWRQDPRHRMEAEDWPSYLRRSFIHEMAHARQLVVFAPMLRIAARRVGLVSFDDDIIQQRFDSVPGFGRAVREETALLFEAAATTSAENRAALARQAVERIRVRRARVYGSDDAPWARVEQLLLDMEGAAQWAAMAHVGNSTRLGAEARRNVVRGTRQYWSEEQGLALYMVLDALVPDWPQRMFSTDPPSSLELLAGVLAL